MKLPLFASTLLGLALAPAWAQAQIKLPVYLEDPVNVQNVVFQEATRRGDFQHGKLLRVVLTGPEEKTIKGTLVRVDQATGRIYVRTEPGTPPRSFAAKEIKRIDKGVIKEVGFNQDVDYSEIRPFVIYNGSKKTVTYAAPTLSPGEKSQLLQLETAENEMARLDSLAKLQEKVLENDIGIQEGQRLTQDLLNQFLLNRQTPGSYTVQDFTPYANPRGYEAGYTTIPYSPFAAPMKLQSNFVPMNVMPTPVPFVRTGATVFPNLAVAPDALAKARLSYTTAQSRAVYENGQLVAVIVPDQETAKTD